MINSDGNERSIQILVIVVASLFLIFVYTLFFDIPFLHADRHADEFSLELETLLRAGDISRIEGIILSMEEGDLECDYETTYPLIKLLAIVKYDESLEDYDAYEMLEKELLRVMGQCEPESILEVLKKTLTDEDEYVRAASLSLLKMVESDKKYEMARELLEDDSKTVRRLAFNILVESSDDRYYDLFVDMLSDQDKVIVNDAVEALGYLGDPRALDYFPDVLHRFSDLWTKREIVWAIQRINDPRGTDVLALLMYDEDVQEYAISALGTIGGSDAIDLLIEVVRGESLWGTPISVWMPYNAGEKALYALIKIGPPAREPLKELEGELDGVAKEKVHDALVRLGEPVPIEEFVAEKVMIEGFGYFHGHSMSRSIGPPVEYYIHELFPRNDELKRKDAIKALGLLGNNTAVMPLVELLVDDEEKDELKIGIAESLALIGDDRAIDYLGDCLDDDNQDLVNAAGEALVVLSNPPILDMLKEQLSSDDALIRLRAVRRLGSHEEPEVADLLISALTDEHGWIRGEAARALGMREEKKALPHLIKMVDDESIWVRIGALYAVGVIGDEKILSVVKDALDDDDYEVRATALKALGMIGGDEAVSLLIERLEDEELATDAVEGLVYAGDDAVEPLRGLMNHENPWMRGMAFYILIAVEDPQLFSSLHTMLSDSIEDIRILVLARLMMVEDSRVVDYLIEATQDDSPSVRINALWVLGERKMEKAVPTLHYVFENDPDITVRANAVWALGRIASDESLYILLEALKHDEDDIRENAAWALGRIKNPAAVKTLEEALSDSSERVRIEAAWALGTIGGTDAVTALRKRADETSDVVKFTIETSIERIESPTNISPLLTALAYNNEQLRYNAVVSLGDAKDPEAVPYLVLALRDENGLIRAAAAEALGNIGDDKAVPSLIETLPDDNESVVWQVHAALKKITGEDSLENMIVWN